jgi:hypothetical protein
MKDCFRRDVAPVTVFRDFAPVAYDQQPLETETAQPVKFPLESIPLERDNAGQLRHGFLFDAEQAYAADKAIIAGQ